METKGKPVDILLVEDDLDHIELTIRALKEHHVLNKVYVTKDGQEALDFIYHRGSYVDERRFPRPGLILLDIRIPKINGLEVLKKLKANPQFMTIPIIMLTTSDRDEEIAESYAGGANSYVIKPVDFHEFVEKVKNINLYWTIVTTLPKW